MNFRNLTRTSTALVAGTALFLTVSTAASAVPSTFNVATTITASCTVTDAGPANLAPSYSPGTDSGTGDSTSLDTACTGSSPTVTFTDANGATTEFIMTSGANRLGYYLSNNNNCTGGSGDNPITVGAPQNLVPVYHIAACVIIGGINVGVPAGTYTDTVTYTISP